MATPETLLGALQALELELTSVEVAKLNQYAAELNHWNRRMNLTGLVGPEQFRRLIVEPVWIGHKLEISGDLLDIGSGNGAPAIPLCVTRPLTQAYLVEARTKRAVFLRHLKAALNLPAIDVQRGRFEELVLPAVDWVTLQAVAFTEPIIEGLRRMSKPTTRVAWITSRASAPAPGATMIPVPDSTTEIWVFTLDQF